MVLSPSQRHICNVWMDSSCHKEIGGNNSDLVKARTVSKQSTMYSFHNRMFTASRFRSLLAASLLLGETKGHTFLSLFSLITR